MLFVERRRLGHARRGERARALLCQNAKEEHAALGHVSQETRAPSELGELQVGLASWENGKDHKEGRCPAREFFSTMRVVHTH